MVNATINEAGKKAARLQAQIQVPYKRFCVVVERGVHVSSEPIPRNKD